MPLTPNADISAIYPVSPTDVEALGTLGALDATVGVAVAGQSSCVMFLGGTWSGTVVFEASIDNVNWQNLRLLEMSTSSLLTSGTSTNGYYRPINISAYKYFRARMSAYTSGSAAVSINFSVGQTAITAFQPNAANFNATVKIADNASGASVVNNALKVDGSAVTQPVSAASLPLPTGAATAANQATGNASLASIDAKLANPLPISVPQTEILYGHSVIAAGASATVVTKTFTTGGRLVGAGLSGDSVASYEVQVNASTIEKLRTSYAAFNAKVDYPEPLLITAGQAVSILVTNASPTSGGFNASLLFIED